MYFADKVPEVFVRLLVANITGANNLLDSPWDLIQCENVGLPSYSYQKLPKFSRQITRFERNVQVT